MAKIIDRLKEQICDEVLTENEIDRIMEQERYYPIEDDSEVDESEEGILRYTNGKSELWVKYIYHDGEYLSSNITIKTKKAGSTRTRHLTPEEIKLFMDYFRKHGKYDEFMIFITELFLARRISDTLCLEWRHLFYENGNRRDIIQDLFEEKTDKIAKLHIATVMWKYIDWYCEVINNPNRENADGTHEEFKPTEHLGEDIFHHDLKDKVRKYNITKDGYTAEYKKAVKAQAKAFRYQFNCAAKALGIEGVSTHSIRKTFGNIAHMLNQFDPDCLDVLQSIYVHDSKETTKIYIDVIDDKAKGMFNGVAEYVYELDNGNTPCIQNTPVIALKTNDLRDIILKAYRLGMENSGIDDANHHMEMLNRLISDTENMRV